jgi:large repetitive protein
MFTMSDARRRHRLRFPCATPVAPKDVFERLEPRVLLASKVFDLSRIPVYTPTSTDIHDVKRGPMAIAGGDLIDVYLDYRRALGAGRTFSARTASSANDLSISESGKIGVTLRTRGDFNWFAKKLASTWGFETTAKDKASATVQGFLPAEHLRTLAVRDDVAQMTPIYAPILKVGSANNQGDAAQRSNTVRTTFGVNGTGVKVGVLSDTVNAVDDGLEDSQDSNDLDNVQVLRDSSFGSDEGRAMLELIHDIAPGASLAFATANGGQNAFANSINLLRTNGANIMVDDIGYPDEPMYQPGVIDTAVKTFTQAGGIYLAAIGNSGNSGWEQAASFFDVTVPTPTDPNNVETFIDWDPAAATTARRMTLTTTLDGDVSFQWDNPWNGVIGNATADLDIRFFQTGTNTRVGTGGLDNNLTSNRPFEIVRNLPAGTYDVEIQIEDIDDGAAQPSRFKFTGEVGITTTQFTGATRAAGFGHSVGQEVISVGAVNFFDAPPVDNTPPIPTADYSSTGPGTLPVRPQRQPADGADHDPEARLLRRRRRQHLVLRRRRRRGHRHRPQLLRHQRRRPQRRGRHRAAQADQPQAQPGHRPVGPEDHRAPGQRQGGRRMGCGRRFRAG